MGDNQARLHWEKWIFIQTRQLVRCEKNLSSGMFFRKMDQFANYLFDIILFIIMILLFIIDISMFI